MVCFQLMDMGFTREHAIDALLNTTTLEQATDYILSHPPPAAPSSAASRVNPAVSLFLWPFLSVSIFLSCLCLFSFLFSPCLCVFLCFFVLSLSVSFSDFCFSLSLCLSLFFVLSLSLCLSQSLGFVAETRILAEMKIENRGKTN